MTKEKKSKIKKVFKIVGISLGSIVTTGLVGTVCYKRGQKSIDKDSIYREFIAKTVLDEYNQTYEHVYEVPVPGGPVYAKWSLTKERPEWLDGATDNHNMI